MGAIQQPPFQAIIDDMAAHADIVYNLIPDRFVTAHCVVRSAAEEHELSDGDGDRRQAHFLDQVDGDECEDTPPDDRYE